jgi:hypothetical protein
MATLLNNVFIRIAILLLLLCSTNIYADNKYQIERLESQEQCAQVIKSLSLSGQNSDSYRAVLERCAKLSASEDITYQIAAMLGGEAFLWPMKHISSLTGIPHNFDESHPLITAFDALHTILESANWFILTAFVGGLFCLTTFQYLKLSVESKKQSIFRHFRDTLFNHAATIWLMAPIFGWMTPLQLILFFGLVLVIYLIKSAAVGLFAVSFSLGVHQSVLNTVEPQLLDQAIKNTSVYICDLQRVDAFIDKVGHNTYSFDGANLSKNNTFTCFTKSPPSNDVTTLHVGVNAVSLAFPLLEHNEICYENNKVQNENLNTEFPQCGSAEIINIEGGEAGLKDRVITDAKTSFLSSSLQTKIKQIALLMYEKKCRDGLDAVEPTNEIKGCIRRTTSGDLIWQTDPYTNEVIPSRYNTPLVGNDQQALNLKIANLLNSAVKLLTSQQEKLLTLLRSRDQQDFKTIVDDASVYDLMRKMEMGAAGIGSLFFGGIERSVQGEGILESVVDLYAVKSPLDTTKDWESIRAYVGHALGDANGIITLESVLLPRVALYDRQVNCWYDQSQCVTESVNPFQTIAVRGREVLQGAIVRYLTASAIDTVARKVVKRDNLLRSVEAINEIYFVYMLLGIALFVIVPMIPTVYFLAAILSWAQNLVVDLLGVQSRLMWSFLQPTGEKLFAREVRRILYTTLGLIMQLLFVVIGTIFCFISFSFLYALNVLVFSALSFVVDFGVNATTMEALFFAVITDGISVMLLVIAAKASSTYISKLPNEMADRYNLTLSDTQVLGEQAMSMIQSRVLPQISNFLGKG